MDKEMYFKEYADKQMLISVDGTKIAFDNSMIESEAFEMDESLCSESELKFGSCEANSVKFTVHNTPGSIVGKNITIAETVDGDTENPFQYGKYKVYSDVPSSDRTKREITAYDAMYDIINADVKAWYSGLSFPMTLKAFRDSFFSYLGIEQAAATLSNDSMTVNKTLVATQTDDSSAVTEESTISGKTVVTAICEINGCFGNMNRDGKFEYVFLKAITSALYPAEDLFPSDNLFPSDANTESMTGHYITFDYEDFQSQAITQLEIKTSDDNAGAIVGTAGNNYSITGNFLVSDKTGAELEQIANNLLPIMAQAAYTPIKSCTCVGNPCLTLGEPIRFNTSREIVETYLLQRILTGVQCKRDSITAQGTQTHAAKVNSIRDTLESVQRRTSKLERNADHLLSEYEDLEKNTSSRFEQTANSISAEVDRAQKAEGELDASLELKLGRDENDQVVSMINASADRIVLRGNRLIVECNNFELDALGRVHVVESLLFDSGEVSGVEILGHDGRNNALLQNVMLDLSSVTDSNGFNIATEEDIPTIPDLSSYINKVNAYADSDKGTTFYYSIQHNGNNLDIRRRAINTSDERLKTDIKPLGDIKDIYMDFEPISYHFKRELKGYEKELQYGLSAQKVQKAFEDHGIADNALVWKVVPDKDFREDKYTGNEAVYKLDKDQLHAMHIQMIQSQQKEIELLKQKNEELERRLSALERSVSHAENI